MGASDDEMRDPIHGSHMLVINVRNGNNQLQPRGINVSLQVRLAVTLTDGLNGPCFYPVDWIIIVL